MLNVQKFTNSRVIPPRSAFFRYWPGQRLAASLLEKQNNSNAVDRVPPAFQARRYMVKPPESAVSLQSSGHTSYGK